MSELLMSEIIFLPKAPMSKLYLLEMLMPKIFILKVLVLRVLVSYILVLGEIVSIVQPINLANFLCEVQDYQQI